MSKKKRKHTDIPIVTAKPTEQPLLDLAPKEPAPESNRKPWLITPGLIIIAAALFVRGSAPLLVALGATFIAAVLIWQAKGELDRDDLDVDPLAKLYVAAAGASGLTVGSWVFFFVTLG